jgi:predicted ATP-dependent endonuclease of OLD family
MSTLILNSLEIRNFRAFRDLKIEHLGRVNLLVGKNNVGKTSLLEAIHLYASRASTPTFIWEIMRTWREVKQPFVNVKNGILLIDEFENGLYYAVQPDLWQFIFRIARRLNVQVFATTHSWDCIEGFQKAAQADNQNEGMLIRLEYKKGEVAITLFDERRLGIATHERIEVR